MFEVTNIDSSFKYEQYWESDYEKIHYWLMANDLLILDDFNPLPYTGRVRVTYLPIINQIREISIQEHENIF